MIYIAQYTTYDDLKPSGIGPMLCGVLGFHGGKLGGDAVCIYSLAASTEC